MRFCEVGGPLGPAAASGGGPRGSGSGAASTYLIEVKDSPTVALYLVGHALHVRRADQRSVPQPEDRRRGLGDLLVDLAPRLRALASGRSASFALSIAALSAGSLSCDQFELPVGTMFFPLNIGSSIVWASKKSFSQPTFGQIATFAFGDAAELRVHRVLRHAGGSRTLKPIFSSCACATSAGLRAGVGVVADHQELVGAAVLARLGSRPSSCTPPPAPCRPSGSGMKSMPGPCRPPASSKPGMPGGMKCVGDRRRASGRRASGAAASRSKPAMTALRTLMLSNGLTFVFSAM